MAVNGPTEGDYIGYYSADIGFTWEQAVAVTPTLTTNSDAAGPLEPGRWLAVARNFSTATALMWLHVGAFEKGTPLAPAAPTGQGPSRIPLSQNGFVEFTVVEGYNDRFAATMSAGTGTLHLTKISR